MNSLSWLDCSKCFRNLLSSGCGICKPEVKTMNEFWVSLLNSMGHQDSKSSLYIVQKFNFSLEKLISWKKIFSSFYHGKKLYKLLVRL